MSAATNVAYRVTLKQHLWDSSPHRQVTNFSNI